MADGSWKPSALLGSGELRNVVQSLVVYLDAVKGLIQTTSSTRPQNPKPGWPIYETDTQRLLVWDGSAWQRLGWGNSAGRTGGTWLRAANQGIATATVTNIQFDTASSVSGDTWPAVPWTVLTMPTGSDGLYVMSANVNWATTATNRNIIFFFINGANRGIVGAAGEGSVGSSWMQPLAAGDTISVRVAQSSGASINCGCVFNLFRIGP